MVEITHGNGYVTRYAHNKKNLVKIGQKVSKGQIIALLGSTGRSTGPHVHFEVLKDGKVVNPRKFYRPPFQTLRQRPSVRTAFSSAKLVASAVYRFQEIDTTFISQTT